MSGNIKFFNKWLYIQRYYDIYNDVYFWRFWVFGQYFDTDKNKLNQNKDDNKGQTKESSKED